MSLVCLDLDGTLEDSRKDMVSSILRVRAEFGLIDRPGSDFIDHVNRGMTHLYEYSFGELLTEGPHDARFRAVQAAYEADYGAHIAIETRLYDGMASALESLSQRFTLALVTNKPETLSRKLLAALDVDSFFSAIVGGDTATEPKPHAAPIHEAVFQTTSTGPVIMVGDSAGDIKCARAYGCPVVWCAWGYAETFGSITPDATAESPEELPRVLGRLFA